MNTINREIYSKGIKIKTLTLRVDNEEMKEILEDKSLMKSIKQDISEAKNGGYEIV